MAVTFAIANLKGGCGKTTAAVNLSAIFAAMGKRTLLIDCDFQANASAYLGLKSAAYDQGKLLRRGLLDRVPLEKVIVQTDYDRLHLVAGDMELSRVNREKIMVPGAHNVLKSWLQKSPRTVNRYDLIVIDSHPSLDLLFQNVMTASDYYLLPLFPEPDSFDGLALMFEEIKSIQTELNPTIHFLGLFISRRNEKNATHRKFEDNIKNYCKRKQRKIFGTIPESAAIASSTDNQKPLLYHAPTRPVTGAYKEMAELLLPELKRRRGRTPKTPEISKQEVQEMMSDEIVFDDIEVSL